MHAPLWAFVEKLAWDIGVAKFGQGGITFVTNLTNNFIFRQTQQKMICGGRGHKG